MGYRSRLSVGLTAALGLAFAGTASAAVTVPKLDWKDCGDGVQCATARVPLDYGKPKGRELRLAVARRPAPDPSRRIGSVFLNPGGPGVSAVQAVRSFEAGGPTNQRFDIVGFDPRGVAGSRPAIQCLTDRQLDEQTAGIPPATGANLPAFLKIGERFAAGCRKRTPRYLLRHVTTADTARDMDLMRRAVGDSKLTYVGKSYGTEIGAEYASLFPGRVRAMVLDGGIDHRVWVRDPLDWARVYAAGSEAALGRFFAFCSATPDACPFAEGDPEASFEGVLAQLDKSPLPGGGTDPRPLDATLARAAALAAMYRPDAWPLLGAGLKNARDDANGALLRAIADGLAGRGPDGRYDNSLEANTVITANDAGRRSGRPGYARHLKRLMSVAPHFANLLMALDSSGRKLEPGFDAYRKPLRYPAGSPTILVVGATGDNATPYASTQALARQLGNARLLTREGDGHTSFGSSECIDNAVRAYLIEGTLPAAGATCARGT